MIQDNTLKKLFDANEILDNRCLSSMIKDTMDRYYGKRVELTDEEVVGITAAGNPYLNQIKVREE